MGFRNYSEGSLDSCSSVNGFPVLRFRMPRGSRLSLAAQATMSLSKAICSSAPAGKTKPGRGMWVRSALWVRTSEEEIWVCTSALCLTCFQAPCFSVFRKRFLFFFKSVLKNEFPDFHLPSCLFLCPIYGTNMGIYFQITTALSFYFVTRFVLFHWSCPSHYFPAFFFLIA